MAGTGKKWLIGCGAGCGSLILISILLSIGTAVWFSRPMDRAVETQRDLVETYGDRGEFTPPVGLESGRIKIFLTVRKQMMASCAEFEAVTARFRAMDEIGEEGDPSPGEVFQGLKGVMGAAFGVAKLMGGSLEMRNAVLIENGMGLGEYMWIYVLAYNSWLGYAPNTGIDTPEGYGYGGRKLKAIVAMMENHAESLEEAGLTDRAQAWRDEAGHLTRVDRGVPFGDSELPAAVAEAFAPYRAWFEKTYCAEMAEFDLERLEKKGMSFRTD